MKRMESMALRDWAGTIEGAGNRETPDNPKLIVALFVASFGFYPFFLPALVTWMFWWFK